MSIPEQQDQERDWWKSSGGWWKCPHVLFELLHELGFKPTESIAVALVVARRSARPQGGLIDVSTRAIAERSGVGKSSVARALRKMAEYGAVVGKTGDFERGSVSYIDVDPFLEVLVKRAQDSRSRGGR